MQSRIDVHCLPNYYRRRKITVTSLNLVCRCHSRLDTGARAARADERSQRHILRHRDHARRNCAHRRNADGLRVFYTLEFAVRRQRNAQPASLAALFASVTMRATADSPCENFFAQKALRGRFGAFVGGKTRESAATDSRRRPFGRSRSTFPGAAAAGIAASLSVGEERERSSLVLVHGRRRTVVLRFRSSSSADH